MPAQRGARPPDTNEAKGGADYPYQILRQSGRTRKPTGKLRDNALSQNILDDTEATIRRDTPRGEANDDRDDIDKETSSQPHLSPHVHPPPPPPPSSTISNDRQYNTPILQQKTTIAPSRPKKQALTQRATDIQPTPRHTLPGPPPLSQTLRDAIDATRNRAEEGQRIFGPISALWDKHGDSDEVRQLPARLRKPLMALCWEISHIATVHFDAYLKGQRASQAPYTTQPRATTQTDNTTDPIDNRPPIPTQPTTSPPTYAQKAAQAPPTPQPIQGPRTSKTLATEPTKLRPDSRLFIWLRPEHKARKAGPFAIMVALKNLLDTNSSLIREVQEVPTGLALCTGSIEALNKLEGYTETITKFFGDCIIQKQTLWTTYRLVNIPRTVNTFDELGQIVSNKVTDKILANAVQELTNQPPTRVIEAKDVEREDFLIACMYLDCAEFY